MEALKTLGRILFFFAAIGIPLFLLQWCESKKDPLEEGMHMNYSIRCENGFKYKCIGNRGGTILLLNPDGTPMKCK